jgi:hypothetical protein
MMARSATAGTVSGMDAATEPPWMGLRRVPAGADRALSQEIHRRDKPATLFNPQASFASCGAAAAAASCPSSYSAS